MLGADPVRPADPSTRELIEDLDVFDASDDGLGEDLEADDDDRSELPTPDPQPRRPRPRTPPLRQISKRQQALCANAEPSWWTKPDANWDAEQQRMRENPKAPRVPSQNAVVGWKAVF